MHQHIGDTTHVVGVKMCQNNVLQSLVVNPRKLELPHWVGAAVNQDWIMIPNQDEVRVFVVGVCNGGCRAEDENTSHEQASFDKVVNKERFFIHEWIDAIKDGEPTPYLTRPQQNKRASRYQYTRIRVLRCENGMIFLTAQDAQYDLRRNERLDKSRQQQAGDHQPKGDFQGIR